MLCTPYSLSNDNSADIRRKGVVNAAIMHKRLFKRWTNIALQSGHTVLLNVFNRIHSAGNKKYFTESLEKSFKYI